MSAIETDEGKTPPWRRTLLEIPCLRLVSRANSRRHWRATYADDMKTKRAVLLTLLDGLKGYETIIPVEVIIDRHGPRMLDDDNLSGSAKAVRDQIATFFGVDDGPKGPIRWRYEQTKSKTYGVGLTFVYRRWEDETCED